MRALKYSVGLGKQLARYDSCEAESAGAEEKESRGLWHGTGGRWVLNAPNGDDALRKLGHAVDERVVIPKGVEEGAGYQREVYGLVDRATNIVHCDEVAVLKGDVPVVAGGVGEVEGVAANGEAHRREIAKGGIEVTVAR